MIYEIKTQFDLKWLNKFYTKIEFSYKRAPYFESTIEIIKNVFDFSYTNVAELASESIKQVTEYIGIPTAFEQSSTKYSSTKGLEKTDRLIGICHLNNAKTYINSIGGRELYSKDKFLHRGIELLFIENYLPPYRQFNNDFVQGLSMIDVMMFNSKEEIKNMLEQYKLV